MIGAHVVPLAGGMITQGFRFYNYQKEIGTKNQTVIETFLSVFRFYPTPLVYPQLHYSWTFYSFVSIVPNKSRHILEILEQNKLLRSCLLSGMTTTSSFHHHPLLLFIIYSSSFSWLSLPGSSNQPTISFFFYTFFSSS